MMFLNTWRDFTLQDFDEIGTASLITRTTNDITQVQQVVIMMLRMVISAPIMFVGGIIMAVSKDAKLSLVILAAMPILIGVILLILKKGVPLIPNGAKTIGSVESCFP